MKKIKIPFHGINLVICYEYIPEEKATDNCPGEEETLTIYNIIHAGEQMGDFFNEFNLNDIVKEELQNILDDNNSEAVIWTNIP